MVKVPPQATQHAETRPSNASIQKNRRRHTRVQLEALRPSTTLLELESLTTCPKCHGLIYVDGGEMLSEKVIRCLNCGWQPFHRINQMEEPEEARTMRALTIQIGFSSENHD
ncbi:MAG: hypothetical protein R3B83_07380 [Nitrospirales bacterium]|nr:hypothetical protein [Nitrospira sp.]MCB9711559.1 hypothetical protein [Nitrospiraceae bacterium]MDR4487328.1 hypothetical protein [Nitrospirales bacterium]HQU28077.1 hypothetical protein [Nitrospirales bacterium]